MSNIYRNVCIKIEQGIKNLVHLIYPENILCSSIKTMNNKDIYKHYILYKCCELINTG